MRRLEGWEDRLAAFVEERRRAPFAWGTNDCVTFCVDAVEQITGERISFGVGWTSELEADAVIAGRGGLIRATSDLLGAPLSARGEMQRGDVCLAVWSEGGVESSAIALCVGVHVVGPGPDAMRFLPRRFSRLAWPVGR